MTQFIRKLFIGTVFIGISQFAIGASFDCSLSTLNATEQFICKNPEISELDSRMATIYTENYKKLSPTNRVAYLNGQRDWLKYWPQSCKRSYNPEQDASIFLACAKREYENRLELLPVRKLNNQWLVFNVARYSVTKADPTSVPDWVKTVDHSLVYPKIETQNLSATELQNANQLNQWIGSVIKKLGLKNRISLNEDSMDSFLNVSIDDVSSDIFRVQTRYYFYAFGAHGNSVFNNLHYLLSKNRELKETDIFQGAWKGGTSQKIYTNLKTEYAEMVLVDSAKPVAESIGRVQSWKLKKDGMVFEFNPYELTAYAAGAPEVKIDWNDFSSYLTDYAKSQIKEMY